MLQETVEVTNVILGYLCNFLKEQSIVNLSNINIDQLVPLLIDMVIIIYGKQEFGRTDFRRRHLAAFILLTRSL